MLSITSLHIIIFIQSLNLSQSIEPWKDSGKLVINFSEPAEAIGPIPLVKGGKVKAPQAPRYASHQRLLGAKTLDEIW
jgi:hypothetical protein